MRSQSREQNKNLQSEEALKKASNEILSPMAGSKYGSRRKSNVRSKIIDEVRSSINSKHSV